MRDLDQVAFTARQELAHRLLEDVSQLVAFESLPFDSLPSEWTEAILACVRYADARPTGTR